MALFQLIVAYTLIGIIAVFFVLAIVYNVCVVMLFSRIRRVSPKAYEALGYPSPFLRYSGKGRFYIRRFLMDRDYAELSDRRAVELGDRCRALFMTLIVVLALMIFTFLILQMTFWQMSRS